MKFQEVKDFLRDTAKSEFFVKPKICEVQTKIKTLDNVKQPLIHLGNNKKRKSIILVKKFGLFSAVTIKLTILFIGSLHHR